MKKQYIFLIMIFITLYIIGLIGNFKYKEYKINSNIEYIRNLNKEIEIKIKNTNEMIEYKTSSAYKNKVLKEQQGFKNKAENVVYLTSEDKYNKFTQELSEYKDEIEKMTNEQDIDTEIKEMSIYEKWIYFLFKKDLNL
ncbi:MAG: hypothetical protein PHI37_00805 [Candidatus Gracilibacteria bacterium]|nr:hypothetical protein [Candidatus Gracilibacteria bacterium]